MPGLVDIHSHLLPGIDDGPPDMESSVEMARVAVAAGVSRMAATPHVRADHPRVRVDELAGHAERLRGSLRDDGIDLQVEIGAEVALVWALEASDEELRLATYGQRGHDILIETPYEITGLETFLHQIRTRIPRVILAHPERTPGLGDIKRLNRLVEDGVLLQVGVEALLSARRSPERRMARHICREGIAHILASDAHRGVSWRPVARIAPAYQTLRDLIGQERADWMARESPAAVLDGLPLPPAPEPRPRSLFGRRRASSSAS